MFSELSVKMSQFLSNKKIFCLQESKDLQDEIIEIQKKRLGTLTACGMVRIFTITVVVQLIGCLLMCRDETAHT